MPTYKSLSENALFVQFTTTINEQTQQQIQAIMHALTLRPFPGMLEIVPSYTNLCIFYDPYIVAKKLPTAQKLALRVQNYVEQLLINTVVAPLMPRNIVEIPVIYGGQYGPDLESLAAHHNLTPQQVIELHTANDYLVYMIGFAPGFPYLGGLHEQLFTPRRTTPRLHIEAGSVGIGGKQTGIYPFATPGGWHIIGRTLTSLFSLQQDPPSLLQPGDVVRFVAVKEHDLC